MNAPDAQRQLLNPAQKNSLRICLMLAEKGMLEVDRLVSAGEHQGLLFTITDDLTGDARTALRSLIHEIRAVIRELKDRFQLEMEVKAISRTIFGKAPLLWEMVADTDASRLRRYGETDPRLKEILDPSIERLGQALLRMHHVVSGNDRAFAQDRGNRGGEQ